MINIRGMTVLIADDSMLMCQSIQGMLKVIGCGRIFLFANNGKEVIEILRQEKVDLLFLDYNMPVMTGGETLSYIREDRDLRDLPVIMVTAEAFMDYVAETGESAVDAYILKPLTIKLMEEKISSVIDKINNPSPMIRHLKMAKFFEESGDLNAAISEVGFALKANPNATRPIREMGYYYFKNNDFEKAEKWLLKAAKLNRLDVFSFHHLGELYLQLNDIEKASFYFEKAITLSPRQLTRGINFAKILVKRKLVKKAVKVFDKVVQLPSITYTLKEEIVDFCVQNNVNEYAVTLLESLIDADQKRWDLLFKLGCLVQKMGNTQKAISCFIQAADINKTNLEIRLRLAKLYLSIKKPILAEKPLIAILEIDRQHEEAKELLKQCY